MKRLTLLSVVMAFCLLMGTAAAQKRITVTFTGDVTLGGEAYLMRAQDSFYAYHAKYGGDYFLKNLQPIFTSDDLTVINLECVLQDNGYGENKKKQYRFRAPTSYTDVLVGSSVELCGLSNNHMEDFGTRGVNSTKAALEAAGLPYTIYRQSYVFEKEGIRIGFISMSRTNYSNASEWMKTEVPRLKKAGCSAVVVSIHCGTEYRRKHEHSQQTMATGAVKAGADLIIMHHPHVLQGIDIINNRYVFYSLGNLCFGGNRSIYGGMKKESALQTALVQVDFSFSDDGAFLGVQPRIYPAHITGTQPMSNFQPVLVSGEEAQAVLDRIQFDTDFALEPFDEALGCVTMPFLTVDGKLEKESPVSQEGSSK